MSKAENVIKHYRECPEDFITDVLNFEPTDQQMAVLKAVKSSNFVAVKSGHGIGKSTIVGSLVWWFLCCFNKRTIYYLCFWSSKIYYHKTS